MRSSEGDDYFALEYSDTDGNYSIGEKGSYCDSLSLPAESSMPRLPIPATVVGARDKYDRHAMVVEAGPSFGSAEAISEEMLPAEMVREEEEERGEQSPRTARRQRNRLAAARMRTRQKQHLAQLERRKEGLERRAAQLEEELRMVQRQNSPFDSSIDKLAEMIDDLTKVEHTMLTGIDECKSLLRNLESLCERPQ
ncbi:hypothetical protein COEREDRAFT_89023 [Coemansia reversa NRRL 1564]|uniref:BZIP domain-containing protein n=1 Tax=Coemansia reversa (strain ATCC 12441 / NRRL 1564) TaxID=763665 RepID=A0A2G5B4Y4_COERN|nr:hypothetical protein COEREDRAFT_89023 [Coemansia reversa NRRL 1564]|eukprot:PIA14065.1 hypothetical protein COEREDRAFT_89023 [Coemansia reversa NRRL 1564]